MKRLGEFVRFGVLALAAATAQSGYGQQQTMPQPEAATPATAQPRQGRSPGGDIGSGSGDIGKGVGKGAGSAAKGAGKGAADLVTLHPVNAAGAVGKGAAGAGKHVAVGAGKGSGKILKGTGRGIKKIF